MAPLVEIILAAMHKANGCFSSANQEVIAWPSFRHQKTVGTAVGMLKTIPLAIPSVLLAHIGSRHPWS